MFEFLKKLVKKSKTAKKKVKPTAALKKAKVSVAKPKAKVSVAKPKKEKKSFFSFTEKIKKGLTKNNVTAIAIESFVKE